MNDIEEPVIKSGTLVTVLLLLLVFLISSGVLVVIWFTDETRQLDAQANLPRFIISLLAILALIITLIVYLASVWRGDNKKTKKNRYVAKSSKTKKRKPYASGSRRAGSSRRK